MLRVFIGYDPRQPLAYNVLQHSIIRHASQPISICPLVLSQLPIKRRGLTEFTYSRFLVPYLCGFKGKALFLDADMAVTGDIAELFALETMDAVSVMQDQPEFEWASAMLFNCGACRMLTPEFIDDTKNKLFDLAWAPYVGKLPPEWNHCVSYAEPKEAKLYHYTHGHSVLAGDGRRSGRRGVERRVGGDAAHGFVARTDGHVGPCEADASALPWTTLRVEDRMTPRGGSRGAGCLLGRHK
jgi:hypothetical protein